MPANSISITQAPAIDDEHLVHFSHVLSAVIPQQSLCSLPISILCHPFRVLSHPVCLSSSHYLRNEFIFSFSFVLHHRTSTAAYQSVVSKLAALFQHLEETTHFLSRDDAPPNTGKIYTLCEILLEDLNNYCEAMIPIDDANTLNIKLFPIYPPPPPLAPHYVPLATVRLAALTDSNWDLTMLRILPYIDGINSIRSIARRADADYKLVRKAVAHLIYYGCVTLLDVFNFGASYAPTASMGAFVADTALQEECRHYILVSEDKHNNKAAHPPAADSTPKTKPKELDILQLVELYCSLRQGLSLRHWCMDHAEWVGVIDVRRFITFGVIKGFLYRVHKYAIASHPPLSEEPGISRKPGVHGAAALVHPSTTELERFLDGTHCFDEICTELMISEKELLTRLKTWGDVQIIQK